MSRTNVAAQDVLRFSTNASVSGTLSAHLDDADALGTSHPPNSDGSVPSDSENVSDDGFLIASDSGSANAYAFLIGQSRHPSGSFLEGTAQANGGVLISQVAITQTSSEPPYPITSNAFIVFNAYASTSGDIVSGGGYAIASADVSMNGQSQITYVGNNDYQVHALVSPNLSVKFNGVFLEGGAHISSESGNSSFQFSFGNSGGQFKLPWTSPSNFGTTSAAGAALVWATVSGDGIPSGPLASPLLAMADLHQFPGGSPAAPLLYFHTNDQPSAMADDFRLVVPVLEGYATDVPVYAQFEDLGDVGSLTHEAATGYEFMLETDEVAFKSFSLPEPLPAGQSEFQLSFDDTIITYIAGSEISFTDFIEGGVHKFSLLGINLDEGLGADVPPSFVHSFRFTNDGTAIVAVSGIPVPEPSSIALAAVGFVGMAAWGWLRRR
jgi:hypothetical protein